VSLIILGISAWTSSSPSNQPELALTARAVRSLTTVSFNPSIPASCLDSSSRSCDRISRSNRSLDPKRSRRSSMAGGTAAVRGDTTKSLETVTMLKIRGKSNRKTVHRVLTFSPHHDKNLQQLRTPQPFLLRRICFSWIFENAPTVNVKVVSAVGSAYLVQGGKNTYSSVRYNLLHIARRHTVCLRIAVGYRTGGIAEIQMSPGCATRDSLYWRRTTCCCQSLKTFIAVIKSPISCPSLTSFIVSNSINDSGSMHWPCNSCMTLLRQSCGNLELVIDHYSGG
jgi:hypothetical protein